MNLFSQLTVARPALCSCQFFFCVNQNLKHFVPDAFRQKPYARNYALYLIRTYFFATPDISPAKTAEPRAVNADCFFTPRASLCASLAGGCALRHFNAVFGGSARRCALLHGNVCNLLSFNAVFVRQIAYRVRRVVIVPQNCFPCLLCDNLHSVSLSCLSHQRKAATPRGRAKRPFRLSIDSIYK